VNNYDKICAIADKWCGVECLIAVYPFRPEWCIHWRYDEEGGYEIVTNNPKIYPGKIMIGIIIAHEKYEIMEDDIINELRALERECFLCTMIAVERDEYGIRLSKNDRVRFANYLKTKHSFSFYNVST
jgi:hypothetical protein